MNPILPDDFFINLYNRSIANINDPNEIKNIRKYISYIEAYVQGLQELGFMNPSNQKQIVEQISKINIIRSLPPNMRGIYGLTDGNNVYINPDLPGNGLLTSDERIKLYTFHELGHITHGMYEKDIKEYADQMEAKYRLSPKNKALLIMGLEMLDESTVQDTSEEIVYRQSHKKRPNLSKYKLPIRGTNNFLFGKNDIISNFDYYGELEHPSVMLARTMRGIGTNPNTRTFNGLMTQLSQRSFEPSFIKDLIREYSKDGYEPDLLNIFVRMGIIKDASYGLFGMSKYNDSLSLSEKAFDELNNITLRLVDWRPRENIDEGR